MRVEGRGRWCLRCDRLWRRLSDGCRLLTDDYELPFAPKPCRQTWVDCHNGNSQAPQCESDDFSFSFDLGARSSLSETTACRTGPGAPAPQGLHWYYRVDRTGNRHCWFLDSTGTPVRLHKDLATSNLRSQVTAEQVLASPENNTVPTAPEQRATAQTVAAETIAQEPSVRGRAATDFTARWFDLPKSVDL